MFAIIRVGGKQYRVENGTQILVDRLHVDEGKAVEGVEVLMLANGDDIQIGAPVVEGIEVGATAVKHTLGKKIRVFKYKAKKNYRRRIGSRPHQTLIRIDSIGGNSELNQPVPVENTAPAPVTEVVTSAAPAPEVASAVAAPEPEMVAAVAEIPVIAEVPVVAEVVVSTDPPVVAEVPVIAEVPVMAEVVVTTQVPDATEQA